MNWLLLPADERPFFEFMVHEMRLELLGRDGVHGGPDALDGLLATELPTALGADLEYIFWVRDLGPLATLGQSPEATDVRDRVSLRLNQDLRPTGWTEVIDLARSPVLRYSRCHWHENGSLIPGRLGAAATRVKDQPDGLMRRHAQAKRWLKREGEKLNPFDHCSSSPIVEPASLKAFWVWARPQALAWVAAGGEIWPWTG